jgi:hypothetical protein
MNAKINWVGLAGGSLTVVVVALSFFMPWWFLSADVKSADISIEGLLRVGTSPLNTNLSLIGASLTIPLLAALNIVGLLSMLLSGIVMLIYSVLPTKPYAKHLLGFSYKKPLILVISFVAILVAGSLLVQSFAGFSIPLSGSSAPTLPGSIGGATNIGILISTGFLLPFWLAIVAAGLCIGARIYHKRLTPTKTIEAKPPAPAAPKEETKPAEQAAPKDQPKQAEPPASETPAPPPATNT